MPGAPDACDLLCLDLPKAERIRETLPAQEALERWAAEAKALADPTRMAIALALQAGQRSGRMEDVVEVVAIRGVGVGAEEVLLCGLGLGTAVGVATSLVTQPFARRIRKLAENADLSAEARLGPATVGGLLGGLSHPLLDGLMHRDVQPFMPIITGSPLLGLVDVRHLHLACAAAGAAGLIMLFARWMWKSAV